MAGGIDVKDKTRILQMISDDRRIQYLGVLPHHITVDLQERALALVNPRPSKLDFTRFSFPSKTIEYLESGNPVVCFDLPGIPKDYRDYLFIVKNDSAVDLSEALKRVLSMSDQERIDNALREITFLLENKTEKMQIKRILGGTNGFNKESEQCI